MTQQGDTVTALISPVRKKGFIADAKRDPEPSPTAVVEDKEEYGLVSCLGIPYQEDD